MTAALCALFASFHFISFHLISSRAVGSVSFVLARERRRDEKKRGVRARTTARVIVSFMHASHPFMHACMHSQSHPINLPRAHVARLSSSLARTRAYEFRDST
tara:strand:- start:906 stop:1214 length:309 start_codon:yes stop_codon:yes gene_type:complete